MCNVQGRRTCSRPAGEGQRGLKEGVLPVLGQTVGGVGAQRPGHGEAATLPKLANGLVWGDLGKAASLAVPRHPPALGKQQEEQEAALAPEAGPAHLDLQARLEADAVGDGSQELGDGVVLLLHLRRHGRLRQVEAARLGDHTWAQSR